MKRKHGAIKTILQINFSQWRHDDKIWIVFSVLLVLLTVCFVRIPFFCLENNAKVSPFLLSLIFISGMNGNGNIKILVLFGSVLLFSDAPFMFPGLTNVLYRCGRRSWCKGECLYIVLASAIYVGIIALFTVLIALPCIDLSGGWGSFFEILNNQMKENPALGLKIMPGIYLPSAVGYSEQQAVQVFLFTFPMFILQVIFLGLLVYILNLILKKSGPGIAVAAGLILLDPVLNYFMNDHLWWLYLLSPVNWSSMWLLEEFSGRGYLTREIVFGALTGLVVLEAALIRILSGNIDIPETISNTMNDID